MTDAQTGLRKALARTGSSVVAIAEMQSKDILANLSDEQRAELAAELAPQAAQPPAQGASEAPEKEDKSGDAMCEDGAEAGTSADANASASSRVKAVAAAVASDENCKGKADIALAMLADDDFAYLSASAIIKLVGKTNAPSASGDDAENGSRAMMDAIKAQQNANLGSNGEITEPVQAANHGWNEIHASIRERRGGNR
jgi:hypothetical protein